MDIAGGDAFSASIARTGLATLCILYTHIPGMYVRRWCRAITLAPVHSELADVIEPLGHGVTLTLALTTQYFRLDQSFCGDFNPKRTERQHHLLSRGKHSLSAATATVYLIDETPFVNPTFPKAIGR